MATDADVRKLPYAITWSTLRNFVEKLEREGIPDRIDRSIMPNLPNQTKSYLMGALKTFGLIDDAGNEQPLLREVVDPTTRKQAVAGLLQKHYPGPVELGRTSTTAQQLDETFQGLGFSGDPKRKAINFYLAAAQDAGVPVSPLWTIPKARTSTTGPRAPRKTRRKAKPEVPAGPPTNANSTTLQMNSGGTVTVSVNVPFWDLNEYDKQFIDDLRAHIKSYPPAAAQVDEDEEAEGGDE